LDSYVPSILDIVWLLKNGPDLICLGKLEDGATPPPPPAWSAWAPTTNNLTEGDGTTEGAYQAVGQTCFFRWKFTCGASTSVGSIVQLLLPFTPEGGGVCAASYYDTSASGRYPGAMTWEAGSTTATLVGDPGPITAITPFTWATGDRMWVSGLFEMQT